jgi:hypothetical protein
MTCKINRTVAYDVKRGTKHSSLSTWINQSINHSAILRQDRTGETAISWQPQSDLFKMYPNWRQCVLHLTENITKISFRNHAWNVHFLIACISPLGYVITYCPRCKMYSILHCGKMSNGLLLYRIEAHAKELILMQNRTNFFCGGEGRGVFRCTKVRGVTCHRMAIFRLLTDTTATKPNCIRHCLLPEADLCLLRTSVLLASFTGIVFVISTGSWTRFLDILNSRSLFLVSNKNYASLTT